MACVICLTRMYYPNVTVISIRNLLLIIVCLKTCNHYYAICTDACTFDVCILINRLIEKGYLADYVIASAFE